MKQVHGADLTAGVEQRPIMISTGRVELPLLYRDGSMLVVGYRIEGAGVQAVLADLPFEPYIMFGRALVLVVLGEYRNTSIGPYNEIGILVLVQRRGSTPSIRAVLRDIRAVEDVGLYVTNLPVNTEVARAGGVELYGFPKYLTGIDTSFRPDMVHVNLQNEFTITHSRRLGINMKGLPIVTFTLLANRLIRTIVEVGHRVRFGGSRTVRLTITGAGPTAATLRALNLDVLRPSFAFRTDSMNAVLPLGKDLGQVDTPTESYERFAR